MGAIILALSEKRGETEQEQVARMRAVQAALHDQAQKLRQMHPDWESNVEILTKINSLSAEWYAYQERIESKIEETAKAEEKAAEAEQERQKAERDSILQGSEDRAKAEQQELDFKEIAEALEREIQG